MKYFIIIVSVLGVLFGLLIVYPSFSRTTCNTFEKRAKHDLYRFNLAIEEFEKHHGSYPSKLYELAPTFIKKIRNDPWGNPYQYSLSDDYFTIESFGSDGSPGGVELAKDISLNVFISKTENEI